MEYRYAMKLNYEDYASGRVLYQKAGMTNFPARLANEIFERAMRYMSKKDNISLYDPLCGGGYILTVLGFLHHEKISEIMASDIDIDILEIAEKNLSLLCEKGMNRRLTEISDLYAKYGKQSHLDALSSIERLKNLFSVSKKEIRCECMKMDILKENLKFRENFTADIIVTDIPYGQMIKWKNEQPSFSLSLACNLQKVMTKDSVLAICSDKKQKFESDSFERLERNQIGKRKFELFRLR